MCVRAWVRACVRACVRVCVRVCGVLMRVFQSGTYCTGGMSLHDDVWVFRFGRWFRMCMDSVILSSAVSLHTCRISMVMEVEVTVMSA